MSNGGFSFLLESFRFQKKGGKWDGTQARGTQLCLWLLLWFVCCRYSIQRPKKSSLFQMITRYSLALLAKQTPALYHMLCVCPLVLMVFHYVDIVVGFTIRDINDLPLRKNRENYSFWFPRKWRHNNYTFAVDKKRKQ